MFRLSSVAALAVALLAASPAAALYVQTNLTSDLPGVAAHEDANLVNPWGLARSPSSPFWISGNGAGVATIADGAGVPNALVVTVPPGAGAQPPSAPTGQVYNDTSAFELGPSLPAMFLFATEDGAISGWNPAVDPSNAIRMIDQSGAGADYKGLALGSVAGSPFLYAANFASGAIDAFDESFSPTTLTGSFLDPLLPSGYAPFNVQNLDGLLYVAYAPIDASGHDAAVGAGNGLVDVFDTSGNLVRRLVTGGALDAPWGMALAPADFGDFANALLVGNFGDGKINAYDPNDGTLLGALEDAPGHAIQIDGLWALVFGGGAPANGPENALFFTAGIAGPDAVEDHGLFGKIVPVPEPSTAAELAFGFAALAAAWRKRD